MAERKAFKKLKINGIKRNTFSGEDVRSYAGNAANSAKYMSLDIGNSLFPEVSDMQYQITSINSEYKNAMQELNKTLSSGIKSFKRNFKEVKKSFKKQIRTGNWYTPSDSFGDDDFGFDDFGFDDDDWGSSSSSSNNNVVSAISNSIKVNKKISSAQLTTINALNNNMASMVEFNRTTISNWAEQSAKYYSDSITLLTEIRDSVKPKENTQNSSDASDFEKVTTGTTLNIAEYGKVMLKNINNLMSEHMAIDLDTILTLKEAGNEMFQDEFKEMMSNPIGYVTKTFVQNVVLNKEFKQSTDRVRESFKNFSNSLIHKVTMWSEDYSFFDEGSGAVKSIIGNLFKVKKNKQKTVDLRSYRQKTAVSFDNLTRKSIIEVIPGYLSKILSAVSSNNDDILYDYGRGKFVNKSVAKKEYEDGLKSSATSSFWELSSKFQEHTKGAVENNEITDVIYEMLDLGDIPLFNDKGRTKLLDKFKGNKKIAEDFLNFLESDKVKDNERLSIGSKIYEGLLERSRYVSYKQQELDDITAQIFNSDDIILPIGGSKRRRRKKKKGPNNDGPKTNSEIVNKLLKANYNGETVDIDYVRRLIGGNNDDGRAEEILEDFNSMINSDSDSNNFFGNMGSKVRSGLLGKLFKKSDEFLDKINDNLYKTAENVLHNIIFGRRKDGDNKPLGDKINDLMDDVSEKIEDSFSKVKDTIESSGIKDKINDTASNVYDKVVGVSGVNGAVSGGIMSGTINKGKDIVRDLKHKLTGNETTLTDGSKLEESSEAPVKKMINEVNEKLFGEDYKKRSGMDKVTGGGIIGKVVSTFRTNMRKVSLALFGSQKNIDLVKEKVKKYLPSVAGGAGLGILASMFLPGGPILGGILGGIAGFANKSKAINDLIFKDGTQDSLIKNTKEYFSKKFKESKFSGKDALKFGVLGALLMPGGPILSAIAGLTAGLIGGKKEGGLKDKFKEYLFGKGDVNLGKKRGLLHRLRDNISNSILTPFKTFALDQGTDMRIWFRKSVMLPVTRSLSMIGRDLFITGRNIFKKTFSSIGGMLKKAFGSSIETIMKPLRSIGGFLFKSTKNIVKGVISAPISALTALGNLSEKRNLARGDQWTADASEKFANKKLQIEKESQADRIYANEEIARLNEKRRNYQEGIENDKLTNRKAKEVNSALVRALNRGRTEEEQAQIDDIMSKYSDEINANSNKYNDFKSNKKQRIQEIKDSLMKRGGLSSAEAKKFAKQQYSAELDQIRVAGNSLYAKQNADISALEEYFKDSRVESIVSEYGLDKYDPEIQELVQSDSDFGRMLRKSLGLPEPDPSERDVNDVESELEVQKETLNANREQVTKLNEMIEQEKEHIESIKEQIDVEKQSIEKISELTKRLDELLGKDKLTDDETSEMESLDSELSGLGSIDSHNETINKLKGNIDESNDKIKSIKEESNEYSKKVEQNKKDIDKLEADKAHMSGRGIKIPYRPTNIFKPMKRVFGRGEETVSASKANTGVDPNSTHKGEGGFEEGSTDEYNYKKEKAANEERSNKVLSTIDSISSTVVEQFKWMKDQAQKASMWKMVKTISKGVFKVAGFLGKGILGFLTKKFPILGKGISAISNFLSGNKLTKGITSAVGGLIGGKNKTAIMKVKANKVIVGEDNTLSDIGKAGGNLLGKVAGKVGGKLASKGGVIGKVGKTIAKIGGKEVGETVAKGVAGKVAAKAAGKVAKKAVAKTALKSALKFIPYVGPALMAADVASMAFSGFKALKKGKEEDEEELVAEGENNFEQPDALEGVYGSGRRRRKRINRPTGRGNSISTNAFNSVKTMGNNLMNSESQRRDQKIKAIKTFFEIGSNLSEMKDVMKDIADLVGANANIQMSNMEQQAAIASSAPAGGSQPTQGGTPAPVSAPKKFSLFKPSTWKYIGKGNGFAHNNGRGDANGYTYFNQTDSRWADYSMDTGEGDTMSSAGCGPTTMAMALSSMGRSVSPTDAASYAVQNGYKVPNEGVDAGFISDYARQNGVPYQARYVDNYTENDIDASLASGQPVIALGSTGRGGINGRGITPYTNDGHYVMITGKDEQGNYTVNDPLDSRNNSKSFAPNQLLGQTSSYWVDEGIDGSQMMGDSEGLFGRGDKLTGRGEKVRMFDKVIQYARAFKGKLSYSMDSSARNKIDNDGLVSDCSAFTRHIFKTVAGIKIGNNTGEQIDAGTEVGIGNEQPGDIILFHSTSKFPHKRGVTHVGLVSKKGTMIDIGKSPGPLERTYEDKYWGPKRLTANRVLPNPNELVDATLPNANKKSGFVKATASGEPDVSGAVASVSGSSPASDGTEGVAVSGPSSNSNDVNPLQYILGEASNMLTASVFGKEYVPTSMSGPDTSSSTDGGSSDGTVPSAGYNTTDNDLLSVLLRDRPNMSAYYEVGDNLLKGTGAGWISPGDGDGGGPSYGLPQFIRSGSLPEFVKKLAEWHPVWASRLKAHPIGSAAFDKEWRAIGKENNDEFGKLQNRRASEVFYAPAANHLRKNYNFDPDKRSVALQSEIHSTAVQYGSLNKIMKAKHFNGKNIAGMSDLEFTDTLSDAKYDSVGTTHFNTSDKPTQKSVRNRFKKEKALVRQMYEKEQTLKGGGASPTTNGKGGRGNRTNKVEHNRVPNKPSVARNIQSIDGLKAISEALSMSFAQVISLLTDIRDVNVQVANNTSAIAKKQPSMNGTINTTFKDGDVKVDNNTNIKADTNPFLSLGGQNNVTSNHDSMRTSIMRIAQGL